MASQSHDQKAQHGEKKARQLNGCGTGWIKVVFSDLDAESWVNASCRWICTWP